MTNSMARFTMTWTTSNRRCDACGAGREVGIPSSTTIAPLCRVCMLEGLTRVNFNTFEHLTEYIALWGFSTLRHVIITPYWRDEE